MPIPLNGSENGSAFGHNKTTDDFAVYLAEHNRVLAGFELPQTNEAGTLLASAARTADTQSSDQINIGAVGVMIFVNVTAVPGGAETLTPIIQFKDSVSSNYGTLQAGPVITATGLYYVTAAPSNGLSLPRNWRLNMDHSSTGSWTYSVGYSYTRG